MIRKFFLAMVAALAVAPAISAQDVAAGTDTLSVSVGTVLGSYIKGSIDNLRSLGADVDSRTFVETVYKVLQGEDTGMTPGAANAYIENYIMSQAAAADTFSIESQQQFIDSVAALPGATVTPSGLVFIEEIPGAGAIPTATDDVSVMYIGRFFDGEVFDMTEAPIDFNVAQVTKGFSEGLQMMKAGGKYRIVMPADLGYGAEGIPGAIPGNAALDFTVDLISINPSQTPSTNE